MKPFIIAAAFVLTATSGAFAQDVMAPRLWLLRRCAGLLLWRGTGLRLLRRRTGYGYYGSGPAWSNDTERGGPGPRVGAGSGMGVGSQR